MNIVESDAYAIRFMNLFDKRTLRNWLYETAIAKYSIYTTIDQEVGFCISVWERAILDNSALIATYEGNPVGVGALFLSSFKKMKHIASFSVIVPPIWQQRGIGSSLVKNIEHLAKNYCLLEMIYAEVIGSSPISKILEKRGYELLYTQKGYVQVMEQLHDKHVYQKAFTKEEA